MGKGGVCSKVSMGNNRVNPCPSKRDKTILLLWLRCQLLEIKKEAEIKLWYLTQP